MAANAGTSMLMEMWRPGRPAEPGSSLGGSRHRCFRRCARSRSRPPSGVRRRAPHRQPPPRRRSARPRSATGSARSRAARSRIRASSNVASASAGPPVATKATALQQERGRDVRANVERPEPLDHRVGDLDGTGRGRPGSPRAAPSGSGRWRPRRSASARAAVSMTLSRDRGLRVVEPSREQDGSRPSMPSRSGSPSAFRSSAICEPLVRPARSPRSMSPRFAYSAPISARVMAWGITNPASSASRCTRASCRARGRCSPGTRSMWYALSRLYDWPQGFPISAAMAYDSSHSARASVGLAREREQSARAREVLAVHRQVARDSATTAGPPPDRRARPRGRRPPRTAARGRSG